MMFTIRVERSSGAREVHACERYLAEPGEDGSTVVRLFKGRNGEEVVKMSAGEVARAMNDHGTTVDTIGFRQAAKFRQTTKA